MILITAELTFGGLRREEYELVRSDTDNIAYEVSAIRIEPELRELGQYRIVSGHPQLPMGTSPSY